MIGEKKEAITSSQLNLADAFVSGLVNLGTSKDTLFSDTKEPFITKVKDKGVFSAVGTLGLIHMWNFEEFSSVISDYFDLKDGYAKGGACIALGLTTTGIRDENDPALALLEDSINSTEHIMKLGSSIGLGLAYAGCRREDVANLLSQVVIDESLPIETSICAALSLALNYVGQRDEESINTILSCLMSFSKQSLDKDIAKFYGVALGILFLGEGREADTLMETLDSVEHPIGKFAKSVVDSCSQIGRGNVLKIQEYMNQLNQKYDPEKDIEVVEKMSLGLIGLSFVAIGEVVGRKLLIRNINHIL